MMPTYQLFTKILKAACRKGCQSGRNTLDFLLLFIVLWVLDRDTLCNFLVLEESNRKK